MGTLGDGDRLPSERVLSERLKVSRTSIREPIIALEIRGIVRKDLPAESMYGLHTQGLLHCLLALVSSVLRSNASRQ